MGSTRPLKVLLWSLAAGLLLAAGPVAAAEVPLEARSALAPTAGDWVAAAAGDLDGDGDADVVAVDQLGSITRFDNTLGDGSTWVATTIASGWLEPAHVALADLDVDGDLDVVVAIRGDGQVVWYENQGATWQQATITLPLAGANQVGAGDLDGDGDLDLFASADGASSNQVVWWSNLGGGTSWSAPSQVDALAGASGVDAGDLDGDGVLDLVAGGGAAGQVVRYLNDGTGASWSADVIDAVANGAGQVVIADADGDGDLDVVAAVTDEDEVRLYENLDGLASSWGQTVVLGNLTSASSVAAGDLDRDGDLDLAAVAHEPSGDATVRWVDNVAGDASAFTAFDVDSTSYPTWIGFADLDGDGDLDLYGCSDGSDEVAWWENRSLHATAEIGAATTVQGTSADQPAGLWPADVDGDGDLDLVGSQLTGALTWWENIAGDGSSWNSMLISGLPYGDAAVADFDGDGLLDVAATRFGDVMVHLQTSSSWTPVAVAASSYDLLSIDAGDWDRDGDVDLVASSVLDEVLVLENQPLNSWVVTPLASASGEVTAVRLGDLDGDGDLDVIAAVDSGSDELLIYDGDGAGGFGSPATLDLTPGSNPGRFELDDMDGDGDLDVVLGQPGNDQLELLLNADGVGGSWNFSTIQGSVGFLVDAWFDLADVDLDGDLDVAVAADDGDQVRWYENGGAAAWFTQHLVADVDQPRGACFGDFDGDGDPDLAAVSTTDGTVSWWATERTSASMTVYDAAPAVPLTPGVPDSVLAFDLLHQGRAADLAIEPDAVTLLLETSPGVPLAQAEYEGLFESITLAEDDGSGAYEVGPDTLLAVSLGPLGGGELLVSSLSSLAAPVYAGGMSRFFVLFELTSDALTVGIDEVLVTLIIGASSARDAAFGAPVQVADAGGLTATLLVTLDSDGDGYDDADDCGPTDNLVYPGAPESCDALDSDCDGSLVDEFDDTDADGDPDCTDDDDDDDGYADGADCGPADPAIHPDAVESCDAIDSDCDGDLVDGFDDFDLDGWPDCIDEDDDGDGDPDVTDCKDLDATVYAGATEVCDEIDQDCDGSLVDEFDDTDGDESPDCVDEDDDGDGDPDTTDCAPLDDQVFNGATEACDGIDSDCDGSVADDFDDTDGDDLPDCVDEDDDGDSLPDTWEQDHGLDPLDGSDAVTDPDLDGRDNLAELAGGTDPFVYDGPGAPTALSPVGGDLVETLTPELVVSNETASGLTLTYSFEVYADPELTDLLVSAAVAEGDDTTSWTLDVPLPEDQLAWWRSAASDLHVRGPWTAPESFVASAVEADPTAPVFVAPLDGAILTTVAPTFVATEATDPEGGPVSHRFTLDVVDTFDADPLEFGVLGDGSGEVRLSLAAENVTLEEGTWYARVHAEDEAGEQSEADVISIFLRGSNDPPPVPDPLSPAAGATVPWPILLAAGPVEDPDGDALTYDFAVALDAELSQVLVLREVEGGAGPYGEADTTSVELEVPVAGVLYWAVRATDTLGAASDWSDAIEVVVESPGSGCRSGGGTSAAFLGLLAMALLAGMRRREWAGSPLVLVLLLGGCLLEPPDDLYDLETTDLPPPGEGQVDGDGDGVPSEEDCDDDDPNNFPGNSEFCDGQDNDCDDAPAADELDGDGDGESACEGDCDDDDPAVGSQAEEFCDGLDDDCDGLVDDEADDCGCLQMNRELTGASYLLCEGPGAQIDAVEDCEELGYALATADDEGELSFLVSALLDTGWPLTWLDDGGGGCPGLQLPGPGELTEQDCAAQAAWVCEAGGE